jgi:hypothetical protein
MASPSVPQPENHSRSRTETVEIRGDTQPWWPEDQRRSGKLRRKGRSAESQLAGHRRRGILWFSG